MAGDGCGRVQGAQRASSRWWMVRQYLPVQKPELTGTLPTKLSQPPLSVKRPLRKNVN